MKDWILAIVGFLLVGCADQTSNLQAEEKHYLEDAIAMAHSEMVHNPELWMTDFQSTPKWEYTHGLMARTMLELYNATLDSIWLNYVQDFADLMIDKDGNIATYKMSIYNMDRLQGGRFLIELNKLNPQPQYKIAIETLRQQLRGQPRTIEGGFWHKQVYPNQMWLDGLYTGTSFYAHYASAYEEDDWADIANQFIIVDTHTAKKNGLNYHGWDESRHEAWADSLTGCSQETWGRAEGWYMMALADVLEMMPRSSAQYDKIAAIFNRIAEALLVYQDEITGMWYQVPDRPENKGNYTESTCTAMFTYAFAKGVRLGILPQKFQQKAEAAFAGLKESAVETDAEGILNLTRCCGVAGLGGTPYRDGTYDYYINEVVRNNDPKGVAPYILAAIELSKIK